MRNLIPALQLDFYVSYKMQVLVEITMMVIQDD